MVAGWLSCIYWFIVHLETSAVDVRSLVCRWVLLFCTGIALGNCLELKNYDSFNYTYKQVYNARYIFMYSSLINFYSNLFSFFPFLILQSFPGHYFSHLLHQRTFWSTLGFHAVSLVVNLWSSFLFTCQYHGCSLYCR